MPYEHEQFTESQFKQAKQKDCLPNKCAYCGNTFLSTKKTCYIRRHSILKRAFKHVYCSRKCGGLHKSVLLGTAVYKCKQCGNRFSRTKRLIRKNMFCSQSCSCKYNNAHRKTGFRRSKAETHLVNLIKADFPNLNVSENNHSLLPSKYEIDILIAEKKLAIELNGPVHYYPIYGADTLSKIQNRDHIKQAELNQMKFSTIVIDISKFHYFKKTKAFLDEIYTKQIKPIIINS